MLLTPTTATLARGSELANQLNMYTTNQDGTIDKVETLSADEVGRLIADHQAFIAGKLESIKSFTETANAEIAAHQAELDILTLVKAQADTVLDAIAAPIVGP